ncbi:Aste57867_3813 [Aphanomyces stellatus]|uniref:Aste57867_3813 protein n=1 Tax=Aphanomyces stellatus TaxID=120398 RepID=A0A485KCU2_9STRA|nr:hypothetical protein As57867_003802 [Aphanomyces stellatus]VFT80962.1 Aste57867_3813 [Aphanomyces stellatus]
MMGGAWLNSDGANAVALDEDGKVPDFDVMNPLDDVDDYFGANPPQKNEFTYWWWSQLLQSTHYLQEFVSDSIGSLDLNHGYYDQNHPVAFVYEDKKLMVLVLFETKEKAMDFDSIFRSEYQTIGSPLDNLTILSNVDQEARPSNESNLRRVTFGDYNPSDSASPQETMSQISSSGVSFSDPSIEEFRYQRIENESAFEFMGKAEKAFLMSKQYCDKYPSCKKFKADMNNILALSHTMHAYFDALDRPIPLFKLDAESVEEEAANGRYKVTLRVTVLNHECKNAVFGRLKDGSSRTDDPLIMKTYVHVENPEHFATASNGRANKFKRPGIVILAWILLLRDNTFHQ